MAPAQREDLLFKAVLDISNVRESVEALKKGLDDLNRKKDENKKKAEDAAKASANFSEKLSELGKAVGGAVAISALTGFLKDATGAAIKAAESQARLSAVLKATGGTVGLTAKDLEQYATALQNSTGTSDEAIKDSMAILATFRSVQGQTFKEATALALDLSAVFGTDLRSASVMLGKALEDPIEGLTSLRRVGITLSDQQQELIKSFMEAGEKAKAQGVILDALRLQVGGAAEAINSASGGFRTLGEAIGDVKEAIGGFILEGLKQSGVLKALTEAASGLAEALGLLSKGQQAADYTANLTAKALENLIKKKREQLEAEKAALQEMQRGTDQYRERATHAAKLSMEIKQLTTKLEEKRKEEQVAAEATKVAAQSDEKAKDAAKKLKEELEQLLGKIDPAAQKAKEFAGNVELLSKAQKEGLLSHQQAKEAIEKLGKTVADLAGPALEALKNAFESGKISASAYRQVVDAVNAASAQLAEKKELEEFAKAFEEATKNARQFTNIFENFRLPTAELRNFFEEIAEGLSGALTSGILNTLAGDDFEKAWASIWQELGSQSATELQGIIRGALTGDLKQSLFNAGILNERGQLAWGRLAQIAGPILLASGVQQQNRGQAALGGAVTGAGVGASFGYVGAIVGAILGAAYGYFSVQDQRRRVALRFGGGKPAFLEAEGPTQSQEQEMLRQLQSTFRGYRRAIIGIFEQLGEIPSEVFAGLSRVRLELSEKVRDVSAWWQQVLRGELPRAMMKEVTQPLEQALQSLGVSADRTQQEISRLFGEDFQAALEALASYVNALVGLRNVSDMLGQSVEELVASATMGVRGQFLKNMDEAIAKAGELTSHLGDLFSDEQVERAAQLVSLAEQQYRDTLAYIAKLSALSSSIGQSIEDAFFGFEEARARERGPEALRSFLLGQLQELQQRLRGATSPEELQSLWQQFMQVAQRLWQAAGEGGTIDEQLRQLVETSIRQTGQFAQDIIRQWQEEAAQRQQELREEVQRMQEALQQAAGGLEGLTTGADNGRERLDRLADAAAGLEEGFGRLLAAADALAERMDALGGLVAINVSLDDRLRADVFGEADLVRLQRLGGAA